MFRVRIATFLLACTACVLPARAATISWTGAGATTHWSDTGNWQGGVVPGAADRALFAGITQTSPFVAVDVPVTLDGIDFTGEVGYTLSGSLVTVTGSTPITVTSSTGGIFTFSTGVTFAAVGPTISLTATLSPGPQLKLLQGITTFSGGGVVIQAGTAPFGQVLLDNVRQTAATSIVVNGNAAYFEGNNVLTGPVTSNARSLGGNGVKPFGAAAIVMNQGALSMISASSGSTIGPLTLQAPPISINTTAGSLLNVNGPLRIQGPLNTANQQTINALADVTVTGKLGGSGSVEIMGPAKVELGGSSGTFGGSLVVDSPATLVFAANSAVDSRTRLGSTGGTIVVDSTAQSVSALSCGGPLAISIAQGSLNVQGPVTANACALTLTVPGTLSPAAGVTYPVITNGSQSPLPLFAGVPDGLVVNANGTAMTVSYHGGRSGQDLVVAASGSSLPPPLVGQLTDMWWGGTAENGWGLSLIQHSDTLFGALYIYDASGNPVWLVMPGGSWDATHAVYTGSLYEPISSPFYAYDATRFVAGGIWGTLKITFVDSNNATLDYSIDGIAGHKVIEREIFGNGAASAVDYSDLWWGGTSQNGWGITILQQGTTLFPVWYTYDANGKPFWYVMPGGTWNAAGDTYSGTIYRTTSSPWIGLPYNPANLNVITAGTYSLKFSGTGATFTYTADGHSGSMGLVREPF